MTQALNFITYEYTIKSCAGLKFGQWEDVIYLEDGTTIRGEEALFGRYSTLTSFTGTKFDDKRLPFDTLMHGYYQTPNSNYWKECSYYEGQKRLFGIKLWTFDYDGKGLNPNNESIYD